MSRRRCNQGREGGRHATNRFWDIILNAHVTPLSLRCISLVDIPLYLTMYLELSGSGIGNWFVFHILRECLDISLCRSSNYNNISSLLNQFLFKFTSNVFFYRNSNHDFMVPKLYISFRVTFLSLDFRSSSRNRSVLNVMLFCLRSVLSPFGCIEGSVPDRFASFFSISCYLA